MESEPLASLGDYTKRYGEPADGDRAAVLLADASAVLLAAYEAHWGHPYVPGRHPAFDRSAEAVACLMVNRVLAAPTALAGATQLSQGAGGYTASVTYGSSVGEMYLGRSDMRRLGLTGTRIRALHPEVRRDGGHTC